MMFLAAFSVWFCLVSLKNVFLTFVVYYLICCIGVPVYDSRILKKEGFSAMLNGLGLSRPSGKHLLFGISHGLIIYGAMLGAYFLLKSSIDFAGVMKSVLSWGMPVSGKPLIFVIMVLCNGFVEEVFWRGYCMGSLLPAMSKTKAVLLTTLFYASYHMVTLFSFFGVSWLGVILVLVVVTAGLLWGFMRSYYKSIWPSAVGHMFATAGYMTIFLLI